MLDRPDLLWRFEQIRAPPGQDRRDLVVMFFEDEIVETRRGLEERGVERCLRAIARMQVKFGICCGCASGKGSVKKRKPAQEGCRNSLAGPDEKVTSSKVGLPQSDAPTRFTSGTTT